MIHNKELTKIYDMMHHYYQPMWPVDKALFRLHNITTIPSNVYQCPSMESLPYSKFSGFLVAGFFVGAEIVSTLSMVILA